MSVAPVTTSTAAAPAAFNPAALRHAPPAMQRAAAAAQFEAILVRQMLGPTMKSMLGGEGSGAAGNVYGDMLADTMAQQLTSGHGLGLSRYIEQQLTPRGTAAPAGDAAPIPPQPAASTPVRPVSPT
jgi:Rod binding domain-containing protein